MQQYVTPQPGRTPPQANITDRDDYKLDVKVNRLDQNQYMVKVSRWIPERGWHDIKLFLDPEELARLHRAIEEVDQ